MKTGSDLNGRYTLQGKDFILIQYYPGIDSYYGIINNDPSMQISLTLDELQDLLKEYCPENLYV